MGDPNCPRPSRPAPKQSAETDFWADLFIDLTLRIEWLDQALDAIPRGDASEETVVRLQGYSRALADLRVAIEGVQTQRGDGDLKFLFDLAGPLAGFLSRLYAWCGELGDDFERMAGAVRRSEPTNIIFSHKKVNKSYAQFDALIGSVRHAHEVARVEGDNPDKARIFNERWEELVWATEWVHLALASSPGD